MSLFRRTLTALEELPRLAGEWSDTDSILQAGARLASTAIEADAAYICLADPERTRLVVRAVHNLPVQHPSDMTIAWGEQIAGLVAATEQPLYLREAGSGQIGPIAERHLLEGLSSCLAVPIVSPGEASIGALVACYRTSGKAHREEETSVLQAFASELRYIIGGSGPHLDRQGLAVEALGSLHTGNEQVQQVCQRVQTPLTSIRGYAQLATKRQNDLEALRRYAQIILSESQRLAEIVGEYQVGG